jgi:predicted AlkP superfamily phosphohydrolase/phosphomutase
MNKLFIFGIDALDYDLLIKYIDELPNFKKLISEGELAKSNSVFPPDSDTAWSTIYTGLAPAEHGIVNFVDPLNKSTEYLTQETENEVLKGKTFWDIAGKLGKKVIVLFPHVGFPGWDVNGIMISRSSREDNVQVYPSNKSIDFDLSKVNIIKGFPGGKKELKKFIEKHNELISNEQNLAIKLLTSEEWDLFFVYSSSLDVVKHFVWKYCDETDPSYPGDNDLKNTIKNFYLKYDHILGNYLKYLPKDTSIIVLSDHGHGGRPLKLFNINEFLRRNGFLFSTESKNHGNVIIVEKIKRSILYIIGKYELGKYASKILKIFPKIREVYTSPLSIDWDKTIAYTSDLSGIKAYSYGGIIINRKNANDIDVEYDTIREKIISILSELKIPNSNSRLFQWIKKREDLYEGKYIDKYPDIVFNFVDEYGAGWEVNGDLFSDSPIQNIVPGSHKANSAVYISYNVKNHHAKDELSVIDESMDIFSLISE